jgi:hypothetical protein
MILNNYECCDMTKKIGETCHRRTMVLPNVEDFSVLRFSVFSVQCYTLYDTDNKHVEII